jgi:hypothetical protein
MTKRHLLIAASALLLTAGCESMKATGAYLKKLNDESNARMAADRHQREIEAHLASNLSETLPGKNVKDVAIAVEQLQQSKGFNCHEVMDGQGADGKGIRVDCDKHQATDLGSAVATNVLGNMLGADRSHIIKESIDENNTAIRVNWGPDGESSTGVVSFQENGLRYKVDQGDRHVEEQRYNLSDQSAFAQSLRASLK